MPQPYARSPRPSQIDVMMAPMGNIMICVPGRMKAIVPLCKRSSCLVTAAWAAEKSDMTTDLLKTPVKKEASFIETFV